MRRRKREKRNASKSVLKCVTGSSKVVAKWANRGLRSECHFREPDFFKKTGKFTVPSIREHPLPGPNSVPAFGTGFFPSCFRLGIISRIFPGFSRATGP